MALDGASVWRVARCDRARRISTGDRVAEAAESYEPQE